MKQNTKNKNRIIKYDKIRQNWVTKKLNLQKKLNIIYYN